MLQPIRFNLRDGIPPSRQQAAVDGADNTVDAFPQVYSNGLSKRRVYEFIGAGLDKNIVSLLKFVLK